MKSGEASLWDSMKASKVTLFNEDGKLQNHEDLLYNEADALEDSILFAEEHNGAKGPLAVGSVLTNGENGSSSWIRFISDLDTDEESDDEDLIGVRKDKKRVVHKSVSEIEDNAWETDSETLDEKEVAEAEMKLDNLALEAKQKYGVERIETHPDALVRMGLMSPEGSVDRDLMDSSFPKQSPYEGVPIAMQFSIWMDREKSKGCISLPEYHTRMLTPVIDFKGMWRNADLSPDAEAKYTEATGILKAMTGFERRKNPYSGVYDLIFLNYHPQKHRTTLSEIQSARAMVLLFFDNADFLSSELGKAHKNSLLLDQSARARLGLANTRTYRSNATISSAIWSECDADEKDSTRNREFRTSSDLAIRPIIAKLYKAGVIGRAHVPYKYVPGQAIAAKEPNRDFDLYFDFRSTLEESTKGS